ncbi:MAG: hypothetical protein J6M23_03895 [Bacteroidales bacterium]|nr:hypothetical protein [Bacteroidales bacterium]
MKKILTVLTALLMGVAALAQPPEEILSRMEEEMNKHENEGLVMTVDLKMPILGTQSTRTWILGNKIRTELSVRGEKAITWSDGTTDWTYISKNRQVTIETSSGKSSDSGDTEMFSGIAEGYDVSIKKETANAWYILCKKSKSNKEKDDPKTMDVVVAKGTYYPVSLSAKASGITMTMKEISFGVTEKQVTFNPADFPDATIVDKRH